MSLSNLGQFSDAQAITEDAASDYYIDLATTRQQIGVGVPIYLCIKTNTAPTQSGDTISIDLQNDSGTTFNSSSLRHWLVLCGAEGAELAVTDSRLDAAGDWIYRGTLPYECNLRYVRLYYENTTSTGTITIDAFLSLLPPSDIGASAQVWVSPVGNP